MGYYCGILVYLNLTTQKHVRKTYDRGVISVSINGFLITIFLFCKDIFVLHVKGKKCMASTGPFSLYAVYSK